MRVSSFLQSLLVFLLLGSVGANAQLVAGLDPTKSIQVGDDSLVQAGSLFLQDSVVRFLQSREPAKAKADSAADFRQKELATFRGWTTFGTIANLVAVGADVATGGTEGKTIPQVFLREFGIGLAVQFTCIGIGYAASRGNAGEARRLMNEGIQIHNASLSPAAWLNPSGNGGIGLALKW